MVINPGTSGLAQSMIVRKNVLGKKLSVLKYLEAAKCSQNQY